MMGSFANLYFFSGYYIIPITPIVSIFFSIIPIYPQNNIPLSSGGIGGVRSYQVLGYPISGSARRET